MSLRFHYVFCFAALTAIGFANQLDAQIFRPNCPCPQQVTRVAQPDCQTVRSYRPVQTAVRVVSRPVFQPPASTMITACPTQFAAPFFNNPVYNQPVLYPPVVTEYTSPTIQGIWTPSIVSDVIAQPSASDEIVVSDSAVIPATFNEPTIANPGTVEPTPVAEPHSSLEATPNTIEPFADPSPAAEKSILDDGT